MNDSSERMVSERRSKRRSWLLYLSIVVGALLLIPIVWIVSMAVRFYVGLQTGDVLSPEERKLNVSISRVAANANVTAEDLERLMPTGRFPELGNRLAQVTVIAFIDFECPFCKRSAASVRSIMSDYGDRVRFIIRDYPISEIHPNARNAAHAANCVLEQGQKAYWRYHDLLFADQSMLTVDGLRQNAILANINLIRYEECMSERRYDVKLDEDIETALGAGVQGTPTFFVNGAKFQGVVDEQVLRQIIDHYLEQVPK